MKRTTLSNLAARFEKHRKWARWKEARLGHGCDAEVRRADEAMDAAIAAAGFTVDDVIGALT